MYYTIEETRNALKSGEITSETLVKDSIETFNKDKSAPIPLNAFIEMYEDAFLKKNLFLEFLLQIKITLTQKATALPVLQKSSKATLHHTMQQ